MLVLLLISGSSAASWWNNNYTKTKHPIVLVHGLFGFDQAFGIYNYFYRIPGALADDGATVYVADVSAANSSELRGEQLLAQLELLQALYGHQKFNLIGHSHGAPTVRYVASVRPELVASVTSVGGPNTGSPVADAVQTVAPPGSFIETVLAATATALAELIEWASGNDSAPQDVLAALGALTSTGAAQFNQNFPEGMPNSPCGEGAYAVNGVKYYSFSGTRTVTNALDPIDALLGLTGLLFYGEANDGLVGRCSSHLGRVLRDNYKWNHGDQVNQAFGIRGLFTSSPVAVYRAHANRLKNEGL
ncbi:lipase family alpha/beta hydrolase [Marinicella meishanensis]|uniref:lipase family alpha/beta hydrolase n=1 Tax=Marinicella meishanensis TaxID=2873263 RepID=UPI001CBD9CDF|nr:triacylglycerol lipase [Marinicella sp. NBU2979]